MGNWSLRSFVGMIALALPAPVLASGEAVRDALRLDETLEIVRSEGIRDAEGLVDGPFGEGLGRGWERRVAEIYAMDRMRDIFADPFDASIDALEPGRVADILDFFEDGVGADAVALETSARAALLDEAVEEGARAVLAVKRDDDDPRLDRIETFVEASNLIDGNVAAALNSTMAFHRAMIAGAGDALDLDEADVRGFARAREPAIRENSEDWVLTFLTLAYGPLSDAELEELIAFARSPAGRDLNAALFAAYDTLFTTLSGEVGRAAGQAVGGSEL